MLGRRARLVARQVITAGQNMLIAQQRDTLRYARVHDGSYLPRLRRFEVGDYVYTKATHGGEPPSALRALAEPEVLRVREVRSSGVLVLEGRDGQRREENVLNCAPCHLSIQNPVVDWSQYRPPKDHPCRVCCHPDKESSLLICDGCHDGYHLACLTPPLRRVPKGRWFCRECVAEGKGRQLQLGASGVSRSGSRGAAGISAVASSAWWDVSAWDEREGENLADRLVLRMLAAPDGRREARVGRLCEGQPGEGESAGYEVQYSDGKRETVSAWQAWVSLLPRTEGQPVAAAAAVSAGTGLQKLPRSWELTQQAGARQALEILMPGTWDEQRVQDVSRAAQRYADKGSQWESRHRLEWPLEGRAAVLTNALHFDKLGQCIDVLAGASALLAREFKVQGVKVISNSPHPGGVAELQLDPLQPYSFGILRAQFSLDVFIMRPWAQLLDVMLPLAVRVARQAVCCQVPHSYISGAQGPRRAWLAKKETEQRVMLIQGPAVGPRLQRVLWLVVFRTAALREQCCKVEAVGFKGLGGGFQIVGPRE